METSKFLLEMPENVNGKSILSLRVVYESVKDYHPPSFDREGFLVFEDNDVCTIGRTDTSHKDPTLKGTKWVLDVDQGISRCIWKLKFDQKNGILTIVDCWQGHLPSDDNCDNHKLSLKGDKNITLEVGSLSVRQGLQGSTIKLTVSFL